MRQFLLILITLSFASCGKRVYNNTKTVTEYKEVSQLFEGRFYLSNNSYIELYQSGDMVHVSSHGQLLTVVNPENDTFGEMPRISGNYVLVEDKIRFSKNLNYRDGNDIEEDLSGNNIRGHKRTDVTIEMVDEKLQITIEIYSNKSNSNVNRIIAKRVLTE